MSIKQRFSKISNRTLFSKATAPAIFILGFSTLLFLFFKKLDETGVLPNMTMQIIGILIPIFLALTITSLWVSLRRKPEEANPTIPIIKDELIPKIDHLIQANERQSIMRRCSVKRRSHR